MTVKVLIKFTIAFIILCIRTAIIDCRQCEEEIVGFKKLGVHHATDVQGNRYIKVFHLSMDFEGNWMDSRSFCKTFDMELATFDSSYEFSNFVRFAMEKSSYFNRWTHIGGISKMNGKKRDWYWINTNRKVTYSMQFAVGQPNNYLGRQNCLGISKEEKTFEFQDIDCHGRFEEKFICQKICPGY